jgi:hypothetical protein
MSVRDRGQTPVVVREMDVKLCLIRLAKFGHSKRKWLTDSGVLLQLQ